VCCIVNGRESTNDASLQQDAEILIVMPGISEENCEELQ
jgi:hypothetical protein